MRHYAVFTLTAMAFATACADHPTGPVAESESLFAEMTITEGVPAPVQAPHVLRPSLSEVASAVASLGGSSSTPLSLTPQSCAATASQQIVITYTVTGRQDFAASFQVHTTWEYDGSGWSGSNPATINVGARAASHAPSSYPVTLTVVNASAVAAGSSSFVAKPFALVTSAPAALKVDNGTVTIHVAFEGCDVPNMAPTLVLPNDMTVEATSSSGAVVTFTVTASDLEDGDLTARVVCAPVSGSTFALGTTTVNCSVTDSGGLTTLGSFNVTVVDTTPAHFTSFPEGTVNLIAADINGAVLEIAALGITVEDVGNVSEPSTFACSYVAGTALAIGSTTTVSCTATDAAGNESAPRDFYVFVGLDVDGSGFLTPLRMQAPFSAHKRGSTIPHKFLPPAYADGTPALDLAGGLRLVIARQDGDPDAEGIVVNDYTAGSTVWRYEDGQYIFNLKTGTGSPWDSGTWITTASYAGIVLATTQFDLRR